MRFSKVAAVAALSAAVDAQRPSNTSICDYYTTALLKNNTAANQLTVLTLLVNTVVIGNYTKPNIPGITFPDVSVPGILKQGTVDGQTVNLLPYFDGGLASSNRGGMAYAINFLDDGGATPLMMNKPANGTSSNQYMLLTHLYQFFGTALNCSQQGMGSNPTFPAYQGVASQYEVHRFMALDNAQVTYFIQQVGLAAESFGVAMSDVTAVGTLLTNTFNRRCAPAASGGVLEAICTTNDCTEASNPDCSAYAAVVVPGIANSTLADGQGNSSNTATMSYTMGASNMTSSASGSMSTGSMGAGAGSGSMTSGATGSMTATGSSSSTSPTTGAAAHNIAGGVAAGVFGLAAFFL